MIKVEKCPTCGSIRCPSCQAPLKEKVTSCPYCGVELVISEDGQEFLKAEKLACVHCGARVTRESPICSSCQKKTWQYCPNLKCTEKFDLKVMECPTCGMEVRKRYDRLQEDYAHLVDKVSQKLMDDILANLDPEERILALLIAVDDILILTDSRLVQRSGGKYFTYPYSQVEDAKLDKFGNLYISIGGDRPKELLIICPTNKEKQFQEAIELLLTFKEKAT